MVVIAYSTIDIRLQVQIFSVRVKVKILHVVREKCNIPSHIEFIPNKCCQPAMIVI